ncbi:hypothetical protein BUALT_Bualt04G0080900 [Buddleja alternifolia]|uniref:K Homology domain-containing protein n=1 Tax=Buddleja alternifolia TaxID=168488 RepID=A0AAV6XM83_9LAMI|nr:hypothetical protein BUALT_Bualt04G0080900 [Buddleja alternifolia]
MEENRGYFLNRHSNPQFKKKDHRKGKQLNPIHEESSESLSDSVYRILCQSKKIGSVIGKGGNIVPNKQAKRQSSNNGEKAEKRDDAMELHCVAQDALLKVHDIIIEEDVGGAEDDNKDDPVVTAHLLFRTTRSDICYEENETSSKD